MTENRMLVFTLALFV